MTSNTKLNEEQLQAVEHKSGPLLIIAGAGTGKTTVITERIKYLVSQELAKPSEILALTFTEKASREMQERVDIAMPYGYTQMWISTFHSFCDRVLRREALHIGIDPKYRLMTEAESIQLLRRHLFEFELEYFRPLGNPNKFLSGILTHFSRLQDEDISPDEYLNWAYKNVSRAQEEAEKIEGKKWLELARTFQAYDELKTVRSVMDFGDLIIKTLKLFRDRPNILKEYQEQFKFILVDEFQDTNFAQNQLSILLAGKRSNITVCGDDDQSIYRFRGAAVSNIIQFRKQFPTAKIVVLTKNYRSTQEILDRSYDLIQHNNPDRLEIVENIDKKLISQVASQGDEVEFIHADRVENEADIICEKIAQLSQRYSYKDFAILVRANNHADVFIRCLARHGIPYQFLGPARLYRQSEVVDLISYLRVLTNFEDSLSFYKLLSMDELEIPARDIQLLSNTAKKFNLSLFEASEKIDEVEVSDQGKEKIKNLIAIIHKHFGLLKKETAGQILYDFLDESGLLPKILKAGSIDAERKATNISRLFDKLKSYENDHEDSSVQAVVEWIDLAMELGESPLSLDSDWAEVNAVNILTVHASKGLEFPIVFIVNLVSQRFPTIERKEPLPIPDELIKELLPEGDYHTEEERRLFYVGMTRAKEHLILSAADYYGEGKREKNLSQFIFEALGEKVIQTESTSKPQQLSFLDYASNKKTAVIHETNFHVDYLSYSQIDAFKVCPMHYKLRYMLKIPTPQTAPLTIGTAVHATLKEFYLGIKAGQIPTLDYLLELLKANWSHLGFKNKKHEAESYKRATTYLADYYKKAFTIEQIPHLIEQPFVVPLFKESERPLKIGGVMDRVDVNAQGIEIIDYKTGEKVPTQKEVDKNEQLTFYALAATLMKETPFKDNPDEITLSLYYFEEQIKISTQRSKAQLEEFKNKLFEIRKEIEESSFECNGGFLCQNCEYSLLCHTQ